MDRDIFQTLSALKTGQDGLQASVQTLQQQNQILIALIENLLTLLAPKPEEADGATLDQLLGKIIAQQTAILGLAKDSSASLTRLEEGLLASHSEAREC